MGCQDSDLSRHSIPSVGPQASQATVQESMEYVESIIADVQRLGIEFKPPITYTSDYFPELLDLAERLIKAGFMYADDTPVEQMREVRTCALHTHAGHPPNVQA